MSVEQVEFLQQYDQWKVEAKYKAGDLSPEQFLIDLAKEEALKKIIKIAERIADPSHPDELAEDIAEILEIELELEY